MRSADCDPNSACERWATRSEKYREVLSSAAAVAQARAGTRHRVWLSTGISTWEQHYLRPPAPQNLFFEPGKTMFFFARLGGNFRAIFLTIFVLHSLLFPLVNHQLLFANCTGPLCKCSFVGFNWAIVLVNYHRVAARHLYDVVLNWRQFVMRPGWHFS
jgi:hypothetical protein